MKKTITIPSLLVLILFSGLYAKQAFKKPAAELVRETKDTMSTAGELKSGDLIFQTSFTH
jgi:hypothetical protein